jgi:uncharacterized membrane protein
MRALEIVMIGFCAALYAAVGRLTDFGFTVGGVAFWPAAVIPAIFAVLFGPWTAGTGAAVGIFIRDMLFHGDPLLSLSAGATSNFAAFFLIGYISRRNLDWKKIIISVLFSGVIVVSSFLVPMAFPVESGIVANFSPSDAILLFFAVAAGSMLLIVAIARLWPEWKNYGAGAVIGLGIGAAVISIVVWVYSQLFFSASGYFRNPLSPIFIPVIFVWTFASEIPFILLLGPPVIKACYRAFPSLKPSQQTETKEK